MNPAIKKGKKPLILLIIIVTLVCLLLILSKYSLVTIESTSSNDSAVYISRSDGQNGNTKDFILKKSQKTFLTKRGAYKVDVIEGNKRSIYYRSFGAFSKNALTVETETQKNSVALGIGTFTCSAPDTDTVTYYPCSDYSGVIENRVGDVVSTIINPAVEAATDHDHEDVNGQNKTEDTSSFVLKPYKDGFLSFTLSGEKLQLGNLNRAGQNISALNLTLVGTKNSTLSDALVGTSKDARVSRFAFFNNNSKILLLFQDFGDSKPIQVDLSKETTPALGEIQSYYVLVGEESVYVVINKNLEGLEGRRGKTEQTKVVDNDNKKVGKNQKILTVDFSGKVIDKTDLPDDFLLDQVDIDKSDNILLAPITPGSNILLFENNKLNKINLLAGDIDTYCQQSKDDTFYNLASENKIYRYSHKKRASFLVYENPSDSITNLSCLFDNVTFTLESSRMGLTNQLPHYAISNDPIDGVRLDSILPLNRTFAADTYTASQSGKTVLIKLDYDSNKNGPSPKEVVEAEFKKFLDEKGVDVSKITFSHRY